MAKKRPREEEGDGEQHGGRGKRQNIVTAPHLQEEGSARVTLRPRNPGEALKVAETVLRKRSQNLQEKAARAKKIRSLKRNASRREHQQTIKSAQYFVKRARLQSLDNKRVILAKKTPAKKPRSVREKPLILVVRNAREGGNREVQSAFKRLDLRRPFACTIVRNDEESMRQLRILNPFVFFGYPTYATLRRLFLARGRLKMRAERPRSHEEGEDEEEKDTTTTTTITTSKEEVHSRKREKVEVVDLSDNLTVEKCLGCYGLFCIEDLIHHLWTQGTHFDQIKSHL
ncbi:60s ribosomal protein l7, partial [Cystoisospora suis]